MGNMNITEINQKKLSSLDTSELKAMHDIFKGVSNPNAKKITKDLAVELKSRKTESIEEASGKGVIKSIVSAAKKIGGVIDKVFDDKEFQDAYAKYIENPKDKKALKKAQAFASGLIDTSPVSGMGESSKLKEGRISKICSIVLGENFCPDFIYEDIDFTKPSEIKEAYEIFEANATVQSVLKALRLKGGKDADALIKKMRDLGLESKVTKAHADAAKKILKGQITKFVKESEDLEEANNRLKAHTPAAAQRLIKKLKNKFSGYKWDDMVKGDEIIYPNELYIIRFIKKQPEVADMRLKESTDLEEAIKWWTVTITKKAGKLFKGQTVDVKASNSAQAIKKGIKQMKGDPITVPSGSVDAVLGEGTSHNFARKHNT